MILYNSLREDHIFLEDPEFFNLEKELNYTTAFCTIMMGTENYLVAENPAFHAEDKATNEDALRAAKVLREFRFAKNFHFYNFLGFRHSRK